MRTVKTCPYCSANEKQLLFSQSGTDPYLPLILTQVNEKQLCWYRCRSCDLAFRSPFPTSPELHLLYSNYHKPISALDLHQRFDYVTNLPYDQSEILQKLSWLQLYLPNLSTLSIADIGCGLGIFLYQLSRLYPRQQRYGIDISPLYADHVRSLNVCSFYEEELESFATRDLCIDLCVSLKVLEHLPHPFEHLRYISSLLKQNQYLFLEVPHYSELDRLETDSDRFFLPHLFFFPPDLLNHALERLSMKLVASRSPHCVSNRLYYQAIYQKL